MARRILIDTAPLRTSRNFRLLFVGQLISTLGNQLTVVVIPFQVYVITHSSLQVGAVSVAQLLPFVVGALVGGSVGDAVDRRLLILASTAVLAVTSGLLAANSVGGHPALWAIYVVSASAGGLQGFANTARSASVPGLVEAAQLPAAFAFIQVIMQVGTVVGPALAGQLLTLVGAPWVYSIDAGTFVVALVTAILMDPIPPIPGARKPGWRSIAEGVGYLRGRQVLQGVYLIDVNAMVFGMPRALFPALALGAFRGAGSPAVTLGYLYAAPGVGALIGAVTTGWVTHLRRQARTVILAVVLWGAAITAFGLCHLLWLALAFLAVAGWADVISAVLRNTILSGSTPEEFRSRMWSIQMAVVQGGPRLGDLESGAVAEAVSTQFSVVSGGLACIAGAAALAALLPGFRRMARTGEAGLEEADVVVPEGDWAPGSSDHQ